MTEEQIISKLQLLKQVKPNYEWVSLVKNEILGKSALPANPIIAPAPRGTLLNIFRTIYHHQKLAYSFAVFMFMFAGVFGIAQYTLPGDPLFSVKKITEQSQAALLQESNVKTSAESLKKRSNDLAQVVKQQKGSNISQAKQEVKEATKNLANAILKDSNSAKEIAMEIKGNQTLLSFFEDADLKEESEILYKAIDEQMIADLEKVTLSEPQQEIFKEVKILFEEGKYSLALEKILLISN